ncbi:hypothetical protein I4U23_016091 [Adineta vaga]|nr:hypothetical protein I4U23_016091 [Adineta vaga]
MGKCPPTSRFAMRLTMITFCSALNRDNWNKAQRRTLEDQFQTVCEYREDITKPIQNATKLFIIEPQSQPSLLQPIPLPYNQQLAAIISYMPKLYRLQFSHDIEYDPTVELITSTELSKLTNISIIITDLSFDEMDIFLRKLPSTLKTFKFILWKIDIDYLDFNMWQNLIEEHFPQLEKFQFNYNAVLRDEEESIFNGCISDEFISPFWINRRLSVEIVRDEHCISIKMKSYKKRWYEFIAGNEKFNIKRSTLLSIQRIPDDKYLKYFIEDIEWITNVATIYHLEITKPFFIGILGEIFFHLPYLDSLKMSSITLPTITYLDDDVYDKFTDTATYNLITKVYLEQMNTFDDVLFLLDLFPRLKSLQIGLKSDIDIEIDQCPGQTIRAGSGRKAQEIDWSSPEKIRKFLFGILLP